MAAFSQTLRLAAPHWARPWEGGYCALVLLALLSNGANATLPLALCLWLAGGLCIAALFVLGRPERTRMVFSVGVGTFLASTIWIGMQVMPLPAGFGSPVWQQLPAFGIESSSRISVAPAETIAGWLRLTLPFLAFLSGLLIFRTDEQAQRAFRFAARAGGVLAALCLVQFLIVPDRLVFAERESFDDSFTFVFVNRNTAATCLGLLALMLFAAARQEWLSLDRQRILGWILNGVPLSKSVRLRPFILETALLLIVLLCLAMTKSRGGIACTAIAAGVVVALMSWYGGNGAAAGFSRRRRSILRKIVHAAAYMLAVFAAVALFAPRAILRSEVEGVEDARFCIMEGLFSAARDNWLTGGGFGAFTFVFNPYRDPACGIRSVWDKAHNTVLEGFIGLGIAFLPLMLVGAWILLRSYRTGLRERKSLVAYPIVGFGGLCLVFLHSLLDFSLQIPGVAIVYAMFAALTVTISLGRRKREAEGREEPGTLPRGRYVSALTLVFAATIVLSLVAACLNAKDGVAIASARIYARALDAGEPVDAQALAALVADGLPSNRLSTCNAEVLRTSVTVLLANLDRADRDQDYEKWAGRLEQTHRQVVHALACLPADGNLWLRLAMLRQAGGEVPQEQASLMALAQQLSPSERRQIVGRLAHWNRLSAATLALSHDEAATDVRNGLNYLPISDVRLALDAPSSAMSGIIAETFPMVTVERRELLKKNGFAGVDRDGAN